MSSWHRYQKLTLGVPELGLLVDLSKTGLSDDALTADPLVLAAFPAAFAAMAALENGSVANPDEARRVGHYWLRAPQLSPDTETREAIDGALRQIHSFVADVHAGRVAPERGPRGGDRG